MPAIRKSRESDSDRLVAVWRRAVDATHDFLSPADRADIELEVAALLPQTPMWVAVDESDRPIGFMILSEGCLEGLFIDPDAHGMGVGRMFVEHALSLNGTLSTDVNEQNKGARAFYEHMGFVETGRSANDGQGRPYPLIHLRYRGPPNAAGRG